MKQETVKQRYTIARIKVIANQRYEIYNMVGDDLGTIMAQVSRTLHGIRQLSDSERCQIEIQSVINMEYV